MQRIEFHNFSYLTFDQLSRQPKLSHGISLRKQKYQNNHNDLEFDFSTHQPDQTKFNQEQFCQALDLPSESLVLAEQVHGAQIAIVQENKRIIPETDGLCTQKPGIGLMLLGADCPLLIVYDPVRPAVGLAHAGWRGCVKHIAETLVKTMIAAFDCNPSTLIAGIGPGICEQCYEVGEEVYEAVRHNLPNSKNLLKKSSKTNLPANDQRWHFNLVEANRQQLIRTGLSEHHIETSHLCTFENETLLYSYRREGKRAGRWALLAGLPKSKNE